MPNRSTSKTLRTALALCALGWLLLLTPAGGARRAEYASTPEGRLRIFDDVWEQVSERYFDPSFHGVDWASLRAELRPRAAEARGEAELYAVLRRMLGSLRDPHTRVYAPGESDDWRVHRYVSVGVGVRELAGQVVVTDVEHDSQARRAGLRAGDAVVALDGEPVASLLARRLAEQDVAVSSAARLVAVAHLFDGAPDSYVLVTFARPGEKKEREATLRRAPHTRLPSFDVEEEGHDVRVVRFNIFTPEVAA